MKLIVQPDDGARPLLNAVKRARRTLDIVVFRFDLDGLEKAIVKAVKRGIVVRALVAHTNRSGDKPLRKLEQRMLEAGVLVSRTNDDLVRYHGKVLIVDRRRAYILGFNFTSEDLRSRSLGVVVRARSIVDELLRLFDCDATRSDFSPRVRDLVVSPENARSRLGAFLRKARTSIDIYDPRASDDEMLQILERRLTKGVRIRLLGKLEKKWTKSGVDARPFPGGRLHVRALIRDGRRAFVGSQSLRKLELDERREVGIIIRDRAVVRKLQKIFARDWRRTEEADAKRAA